MTTFNTGNPIGSTDARDLSDNAENFDRALGTLKATWIDRLGVTRDSFEGRLEKGSFYRVGTFAAGYTLTNMRQTLEYNGHEYSWAGAFPKVVAAGKTPATSGGIGAGAWVDRTSETLRGELLLGSMRLRAGQFGLRDIISVFDYGGIGDGIQSDSKAWQDAMLAADLAGGAIVIAPPPSVAWVLDFPVFVLNNTDVKVFGKVIVKDPVYAKGRGGIVFGSSLEANREKAIAAYAAGTYPNVSIRNEAYVNPALKQYLRDNPQFIESENSTITGGYYIAQFTGAENWGGYAINFVNAKNCHAHDISGEGWTQLIGMGSDVAPETPSNYLCTASNLHVIKPDLVHTYYSVGFIANSTDCSIINAYQYAPCTSDTDDGSGVATAFTEDCVIKHIHIKDLGRTQSSDGVYIGNSKGAVVDDIWVGNAKKAVTTFYTDLTFNDNAKPNVIGPTITGSKCDKVIQLGSKYVKLLGYSNVLSSTDLHFFNGDATDNTVGGPNNVITTGSGLTRREFLTRNTIEGWRYKTKFIRPADILLNDKVDLQAWGLGKNILAKEAINLKFMCRVDNAKAIFGVSAYATFAGNAAAALSNIILSVRKIAGYNGNTGESAVIQATSTTNASNTTTIDTETQLLGILCESDSTPGLSGSQDITIELNNPTLNTSIKEIKIEYLG